MGGAVGVLRMWHAMASVHDVGLREFVSAVHIGADTVLEIGTVVHDSMAGEAA